MHKKWDHKQSIKEVLRHFLFGIGASSIVRNHRRRKGYITDHLDFDDIQLRFEEIYSRGVWVHSLDQTAGSGLGSELDSTTTLREQLPARLKQLNVATLIDVGCGDWTWMSKTELPCRYLGVDIVREVIDRNNLFFKSDDVDFLQLDAVAEELPSADAALCREVIFHLSFDDAKLVLDNIKRHCRWVFITTDTSIWFNSDIASGDFRMLNLQRSPFSFPPPDGVVTDEGLVPRRVLGIWRTDRLG